MRVHGRPYSERLDHSSLAANGWKQFMVPSRACAPEPCIPGRLAPGMLERRNLAWAGLGLASWGLMKPHGGPMGRLCGFMGLHVAPWGPEATLGVTSDPTTHGPWSFWRRFGNTACGLVRLGWPGFGFMGLDEAPWDPMGPFSVGNK